MPGSLKGIGACGAACVAIALLVSLAFRRHSPRAVPDRGPASQAQGARQPASSDLLFGLRPGNRYAYAFERKIALHGLGSHDPVIAYHGELDIDVVSAGPSGFEALASARIAESPKGASPSLRVRMDATGKSLRVFGQSPADSSEQARQKVAILKDLVSSWDFPLTTDTVGRFEARFEDLPGEAGLILRRKTKLRYEAARTSPEITGSANLLKWDPALSAPREITGSESTRMGSGKTVLSSESSYAIRFLSVGPRAPIPALALARFGKAEDLSLSATPSSRRLRPHRSWASIEDDLENFSSLSQNRQLQVFGDLIALFQADGSAVSDAVALLQAAGVIQLGARSPLFQAVVGALAGAGGPAAQSAVIQIYEDPACPVSGKGSILAALTTTQAVLEPGTRQFLASVMQGESDTDLSNGAAFALGASLQRAPSDEQSAQEIGLISQAWQASQSSSSSPAGEASPQELALLDAMGNSGQPEYLQTLEGVIDDDADPALRAKAVFALRFMPGEAPVQLLTQSLSDPSTPVRQAAVSAMALAAWNTAFLAPLQGCAAGDPVSSIQSACQAAVLRHSGSS